MQEDYPFNDLVPELKVADIRDSLRFWCEGLGFRIAYDRPEEGFAYLERGSLQVMLDQFDETSRWNVGSMQRPLGQGINLQMFVSEIASILAGLEWLNWPLFWPVEEKWYRTRDGEGGNRQFLVQDPDGYLLRFAESLGTRSVSLQQA